MSKTIESIIDEIIDNDRIDEFLIENGIAEENLNDARIELIHALIDVK
jgi:hypothetical protein